MKTVPPEHTVRCPICLGEYDLFSAPWCEHWEDEPSKVCLRCGSCLCGHPGYSEPLFWKDAPVAFQKQGFRRLFLLYL